MTALYEFDRHLKSLIHNGLKRVEVALRSQSVHCLGGIWSARFGVMPHDDGVGAPSRPALRSTEMLTTFDPVTWQPRRIAIAGVSGSGKSTLAQCLSVRLGIPYVEIDSLFHGPNWEPRGEFVRDVATIISGDSWVIERQYEAVRAQIVERADTLVWLDLPTPLTLYQLARRTIRRRLRQVERWNGNYEGPLHRFFTDSGHILRWGIRTRNKLRDRVPAVDAHYPSLRVVRLASRRDIALWVSHAVAYR